MSNRFLHKAPAGRTWVAAAWLGASLLAGCAPLLVGGVVAGGAMVAADRRSSASMIDDQQIEQRVGILIYEAYGSRAHVSVTSFNARVLLTGEVPAAADQARVSELARAVDKVRVLHNETVVALPSNFATRTRDTWLTGKVKSALLGASGVSANDVKVVSEQGTVYLMGRLTAHEAEMATEIARTTSGVQRVVRLIDLAPPLGAQSAAPATTAAPLSGASAAAPTSSASPTSGAAASGATVAPVVDSPLR